MSNRKSKKSQKLGSTRHRNRYRDTEEWNNDGFPQTGNEDLESNQKEFHAASEFQSADASLLLHSHPAAKAITSQQTSELNSQSQDYKDLFGQDKAVSKRRKMGSTRKSNREFKAGGIPEEDPEDKVEVSEGISQDDEVTVKEERSEEEPDQQSPSTKPGRSTFEIQHAAFDSTMHIEKAFETDGCHDLEIKFQIQPIPMVLSSCELETHLSEETINHYSNVSLVTPTERKFPLHESDDFSGMYNQMEALGKTTGQSKPGDSSDRPLNENWNKENRESQNPCPAESFSGIPECTFMYSSEPPLNFTVNDRQERESTILPHACRTEAKGEVAEVQSTRFINESQPECPSSQEFHMEERTEEKEVEDEEDKLLDLGSDSKGVAFKTLSEVKSVAIGTENQADNFAQKDYGEFSFELNMKSNDGACIDPHAGSNQLPESNINQDARLYREMSLPSSDRIMDKDNKMEDDIDENKNQGFSEEIKSSENMCDNSTLSLGKEEDRIDYAVASNETDELLKQKMGVLKRTDTNTKGSFNGVSEDGLSAENVQITDNFMELDKISGSFEEQLQQRGACTEKNIAEEIRHRAPVLQGHILAKEEEAIKENQEQTGQEYSILLCGGACEDDNTPQLSKEQFEAVDRFEVTADMTNAALELVHVLDEREDECHVIGNHSFSEAEENPIQPGSSEYPYTTKLNPFYDNLDEKNENSLGDKIDKDEVIDHTGEALMAMTEEHGKLEADDEKTGDSTSSNEQDVPLVSTEIQSDIFTSHNYNVVGEVLDMESTEKMSSSQVHSSPPCGTMELFPESQDSLNIPAMVENIHEEKSDQTKQSPVEQTNRESEPVHLDNTFPLMHIQESKPIHDNVITDHSELGTSRQRRKMGSTRKSNRKQLHKRDLEESTEELNIKTGGKKDEGDQDVFVANEDVHPTLRSNISSLNDRVEEESEETTEKRIVCPTDYSTSEDFICSDPKMHSGLSSQTSELGLTVDMQPSPITEPSDSKSDRANSKESVETGNTEPHSQRKNKKKRKFGSTRKSQNGHRPNNEGAGRKWEDVEATEGPEHGEEERQETTDQEANSDLLTEPEIVEEQIGVTDPQLQTEMSEIKEEKGDYGMIGTTPVIMSDMNFDQVDNVTLEKESKAEVLLKITEQHGKLEADDGKTGDSTSSNKQDVPPVRTEIQNNNSTSHNSTQEPSMVGKGHEMESTEKMSSSQVHSSPPCGTMELLPESKDRLNIPATVENINESDQTKQLSWDHSTSEAYVEQTNRESEPVHLENTFPLIHMQESKLIHDNVITDNSELGTSRQRRKMGSTRKSNKKQLHEGDLEESTEELNIKTGRRRDEGDQGVYGANEDMFPKLGSEPSDSIETENTEENVETENTELHTQSQNKQKRKFVSTRQAQGGHRPDNEGEENKWKYMEATERPEHGEEETQETTVQEANSDLLTEQQIVEIEEPLGDTDPQLQTEMSEIKEEERDNEMIGTLPVIISHLTNHQVDNVVLEEESIAESLVEITEQHEKLEVDDEKVFDFTSSHEQETTEVDLTINIQPSSKTEHSASNEEGVKSVENVETVNTEPHTQSQNKKKRKFGSTLRSQGGNSPDAEGYKHKWKDMEDAEGPEHGKEERQEANDQAAHSDLLTEQQLFESKEPLVVTDPHLQTELLGFKDEERDHRISDTPLAILSEMIVGQVHNIILEEESEAGAQVEIKEQHGKLIGDDEKICDSTSSNEQEMPPVSTEIQNNTFTRQNSFSDPKVNSGLSSQTTELGLTTNIEPSPITEPSDSKSDRANSIESVDPGNTEPHSQRENKNKRKFGSTRKSQNEHRPDNEGAGRKWEDVEAVEGPEHGEEERQETTDQEGKSDLLTEPQIVVSEETLCATDPQLQTERSEIKEEERDHGMIGTLPVIISNLTDHQVDTVVLEEGNETGTQVEKIEQHEKLEDDDKICDSRSSNGLEMPPVSTEIQNTFTCHNFSLGPKINSGVSYQTTKLGLSINVRPSPITETSDSKGDGVNSKENVETGKTEPHAQSQNKKKRKFGSTRRTQGGHRADTEGDECKWEVTEGLGHGEEGRQGTTDQAAASDMLTCSDEQKLQAVKTNIQIHTLSDNTAPQELSMVVDGHDIYTEIVHASSRKGTMEIVPEMHFSHDISVNTESSYENSDRESETEPIESSRTLNLIPELKATVAKAASEHSEKRWKIGSTRKSHRADQRDITKEMQAKENTEGQKMDETSGHTDEANLEPEVPNVIPTFNAETSDQFIEKQSETRESTDEITGDMDSRAEEDIATEETTNVVTNLDGTYEWGLIPDTMRQGVKPPIHHNLDEADGSLLIEIERELQIGYQSQLRTRAPELISERLLDNTLKTCNKQENISEIPQMITDKCKGTLELPSTQSSQTCTEPSSPGRKRKFGSTRKTRRNKLSEETDDDRKEPEQVMEKLETGKNSDPMRETETVMLQVPEAMGDMTSEVEAVSRVGKNDTVAIKQPISEGNRKFGSSRKNNTKRNPNLQTPSESEPNQQETEDSNELLICDPYFISETESTPISQPSDNDGIKASPDNEQPGQSVASESAEAALVCLDDLRKFSFYNGSSGRRETIDFEQWPEQIPDFGVAVYNVVMVGNSNVGKTSFVRRFQCGQFSRDYSSTIGVDSCVQNITLGNRTVKLNVWDTAGQERYHSLTRQVFHKAQSLLLMYDTTSSQSFYAVRNWISQIQERAPADVIVMLLGNKCDCAGRQVQLQDGENLAREYGIHFMECSAATGENVSECVKTVAWLLVKQSVRREEEQTILQPKQPQKSGCC